MGLIDRFNAPRQSRAGRVTVWSSEPTDILDELAAEDAEIIRAAKPVRAIILPDVSAALGDLFGGLVERIASTEERPVPFGTPDAVSPMGDIPTTGRSLDGLRRWLRSRQEDGE